MTITETRRTRREREARAIAAPRPRIVAETARRSVSTPAAARSGATRPRRSARVVTTTPAVELPAAHYKAVDGLRAIAILSVLVFHTGLYVNGLFGVDLFFVLSGFLITLTLLREHHRSGTVHLGRFYLKRFKRLVPLLLVVLTLTGIAVVALGSPAEIGRLAKQALASLLYVANWEQLAAGQNYWDGFGAINPLGHMWSLSITEQFYLLWPAVVVLVLVLGRRRRTGTATTLAAARPWAVLVVAGAGYLVAILQPVLRFDGQNADRLYLGTDTHAMGLLAGAAAAAISHLLVRRRATRLQQGLGSSGSADRFFIVRTVATTVTSVMSFALIVILSIQASDYRQAWLYEWGFAAVAVLGAVLVLTLTSQHNFLTVVLSWRPLVAIGKVSYTLFLVHLPIYWLITAVQPANGPVDILVLGIPGSLMVAGALHHLLGEPVRLAVWGRKGFLIFGAGLAVTGLVVAALPALAQQGAADRLAYAGTGGVRVLTLGDSLANDFASALKENAADAVTIIDGGLAGCGISGSDIMVTAAGINQQAPYGCNPWQERWAGQIDVAKPDVIIANLAWDAVKNYTDNGGWGDLCDPTRAGAYGMQLDRLAAVTAGTPVLLANARLHNPLVTPEQAECFDAVLDAFVADHPEFKILDLQGQVCDEAQCADRTAHGAKRYLDDRVHFSDAGKAELAPWLLENITTVRPDETPATSSIATTPDTTAATEIPQP